MGRAEGVDLPVDSCQSGTTGRGIAEGSEGKDTAESSPGFNLAAGSESF